MYMYGDKNRFDSAVQMFFFFPDKGIASLNRILRKTEVLKLKKLRQITSEGVKSIISRSLQHVNLRESTRIADHGIIALVKNCPNIKKLNVCDLHKLSDNSLIQVAVTLGEKLVSYLFLT